MEQGRVADPGGVDPDPDPTLKKKPGPDPQPWFSEADSLSWVQLFLVDSMILILDGNSEHVAHT